VKLASAAPVIAPSGDLLPIALEPSQSAEFRRQFAEMPPRTNHNLLRRWPGRAPSVGCIQVFGDLQRDGKPPIAPRIQARYVAAERYRQGTRPHRAARCLTLRCTRRPTAGFARFRPRVNSNVSQHEPHPWHTRLFASAKRPLTGLAEHFWTRLPLRRLQTLRGRHSRTGVRCTPFR